MQRGRGVQGVAGADGQDGANGIDGKDGADGTNGTNGTNGADGREIELQKDLYYIQWRYVGEPGWRNLIAYSDLKGDKGDKGDTGATGATGPANTLSIGSVTKPSDCVPTASITGTAPNQTLNLGIPGLPNGGTTNQLLFKKSGTNCDVEWATADQSKGIATTNYVQSRGQNLVTNGTGLLGNNYNFSSFTFDQTEVYSGMGSFKDSDHDKSRFTDELIPVDPSGQYELSLYAKATTYVAGAKFYSGLSPYDIDGNSILPYNYMKYAGSTDTTLASNLNPGDATITLTDATGWSNGSIVYSRNIAWYGYTNSKGYTYPDYTYTRNVSSTLPDNNNHGNGLWSSGGISGNTITLRNPWNGPAIPAGKAVRNTGTAGSYKYIGAVGVNVPSAWTKYSGITTGVDESGAGVYSKLPYGTAYVRLVFLPNYNGAGNVTNLSNITFTKVPEGLVLTSPNGTRYRVNVDNSGALSASAL